MMSPNSQYYLSPRQVFCIRNLSSLHCMLHEHEEYSILLPKPGSSLDIELCAVLRQSHTYSKRQNENLYVVILSIRITLNLLDLILQWSSTNCSQEKHSYNSKEITTYMQMINTCWSGIKQYVEGVANFLSLMRYTYGYNIMLC